MVEHEPHVRQAIDRLDDQREMLGRDHQVVYNPRLGHGGQPFLHAGASQVARVGLYLELMADADQLLAAGRRPQSGQGARHVRAVEVHPADHARQRRRVRGKREQVKRLACGVAGLDDHGGIHTMVIQHLFQVGQQERPSKQGKLIRPRLWPHRQIPQVHVGVDNCHERGRSRKPAMPPSTASSIPVVDPARGDAR